MKYGRVENGNVVVGLPSIGTLKNGNSVSGYNLLPEGILIEEGWLPLIENIPQYNNETEVLQGPNYVVETTQITANYIINLKPPVEPQQITQEEKIAMLETQLAQTNADFQEFMNFYFSENPVV